MIQTSRQVLTNCKAKLLQSLPVSQRTWYRSVSTTVNLQLSDKDQTVELPKRARPIVVIGCGAIVRCAHLPAYRLAKFPVVGAFDVNRSAAEQLAKDFSIPRVYTTIEELVKQVNPQDVVFDVAVPAINIESLLRQLPERSTVLIQKPMGENLEHARAIRQVCQQKQLKAAINLQLRYAPYILAAKALMARGVIGELHQIDVKVNVYTPWQLWTFLEKASRMEPIYHSIHYVDLIRSVLGEPSGVYCFTNKHPYTMKLDSSRSAIIFNYGPKMQVSIHTNHGHDFGRQHAESYVKFEGTQGVIKAQMGVNFVYPTCTDDYLDVFTKETGQWQRLPVHGTWFPHAFKGPMASLQRWAEGSVPTADTNIDDGFRTMAVLEAAYQSHLQGGTPPPVE